MRVTQRMKKGVLQPDGSTKVEPVMDVRHVADAVLYMGSLPPDANAPFLTVMANGMPFIGEARVLVPLLRAAPNGTR